MPNELTFKINILIRLSIQTNHFVSRSTTDNFEHPFSEHAIESAIICQVMLNMRLKRNASLSLRVIEAERSTLRPPTIATNKIEQQQMLQCTVDLTQTTFYW